MSLRRIWPLAVAALFALTMFSVVEPVSALPPATTGVESKVVPGGTAVVPSGQRYQWVDSSAPGCKAPSLIGSGIPIQGSIAAPAKGCPLGWDEVAGTPCRVTSIFNDGAAWPGTSPTCIVSCCSYQFSFYGQSAYPSNGALTWWVNENGFITFRDSYGIKCGVNTRNPVQLPATASGTGCSTAASAHPLFFVAGFWTNMRIPSSSAVGAGVCWDTPPGPTADAGRIWTSPITGATPMRYVVIEYDRVLVNTNDAPCNPSPLPNHFATFQYKLWIDIGAIDVIYKNVDHNNQPFSLGIQNSGGATSNAIGLNYCSPTVAAQCDASSPNLVDRAVRYYQNTHVVMGPMHNPVRINEDCGAVTATPVGVACTYAMPDSYYYDPDYQNPRPPATYCIQIQPTRGVIAGVPACSTGTYATGTYTPYTNFNGADTYQFRVREADGSISGYYTGTLVINPVNDAPIGYTHNYDVISGDSRFVTLSQGVAVEFPAGALNAPTDAESPPQRNTWMCSSVPPSGTAACAATPVMVEGGPSQTLTAAMTACTGYDATWDPQHGDVTFTDFDDIVKPGVHPSGSFNFAADVYVGADSFKFCMYDGTVYGPAATVNINLIAGVADYVAIADSYSLNEDGGPLVGEGPAAPAANDEAAGCSGGGLQYEMVPGSGPFGAASFVWDSASGSFAYTPLPDWTGDDGFSYQMSCGGGPVGLSNEASVKISVLAINDAPVFAGWNSWGDLINEDNGVISSTPVPFTRTVANFVTGIGVGGGLDEFMSQTVRPVIVSQTNTALFTSTVPCPANYDFALPPASCPTTYGPALELSGPSGSQVITLRYTTKPDANGSDTVCFRLMDTGGTALGGKNQNTMPPAAPLCFVIKILPVADVPRPVDDAYTVYQGHELFAAAPAVTFPGAIAPVYTLLQGNPGGLTPDLEVDGEVIKSFVSAQPGYGKLWYLYNDGSFHYTPPASLPRVVTGSPSIGTLIPTIGATVVIGSEKYRDTDASGAFSSGDKLYLDVDDTNTVTVKDVRLTWVGSFPAGSIVTTGDSDISLVLAVTDHLVTCYYDADANGAFSAVDPIYLQLTACGPGGVTAGALRLSEGAAGFGGSIVAAGEQDVGRNTVAVPGASRYCYQQKDLIAGYSVGDWVFLDAGSAACTTISIGDVLLTWGTQTFTYYVQDSSGSNSPIVTATIRILGNTVPVGTWAAASEQANVGDIVSFTSACADADAADMPTVVTFWDFGDGYTTTGSSPMHAFATAGTYTVSFYCYDVHGDFSKVTRVIKVSGDAAVVDPGEDDVIVDEPGPGVGPLAADAGEDQVVVEEATVVLLGSGSGAPTTWSWTQVSGIPVTLLDADKSSASFTAPILPSLQPVNLVFALVVGDGTATSVADSVTVQVTSANTLPLVRVVVPPTAHEGDKVTLDGSASSDANGDAMTYAWTQISGPAVQIEDASSSVASFTVPAGSLGRSFVFALEVSDGKGSSVDAVPVLVSAKIFTGPGFAVEVAADGVVTATPYVEAVNYVWEFGDNSEPVASSGPITHTYAARGDYTIRLTAHDANGAVLAFHQAVPVGMESVVHEASVPTAGASSNAAYAAWFLAGGAVVLLAGLVGLAIFMQRRKK